jgi:TrmH family RNA methyltransferase
MPLLASRNNPKIKLLRALRRRKERDSSGLCVVEGFFHIGEALGAYAAGVGAAVEYLCYAPDLLAGDFGRVLVSQAEQQGIPTYAATAEVLAAASDKDNPQGLLAVVRQRQVDLAGLSPKEFPRGVALVAPQDPGNVGTILRTVDATAMSGLILLDAGVDPYHPTAIRASMGAVFWLPVVGASFPEFAEWASVHGYHLYGTSTRGTIGYRAARYAQPFILLMGSEREGLKVEQTAVCEQLIAMPMHGRVSSLNLAVATGIMLYTIAEQLPA